MFIDDEAALRDWLVTTLEPLCDAEPIALARYVLALVAKDKPLDKLRENCIDRLEVFLDRSTKDFVDQLFDVIKTRQYIPEGKKENVQPKTNEDETRSSEIQEENVPDAASSTTTKKRYSSKRSPDGSPVAKRTQRSYSQSSSDSPSSDRPNNNNNNNHSHNNSSTSSSTTKIPCKDFFDKIGYCALGDTCPHDHGSNVVPYDQRNYYPTYQPYNPEVPDIIPTVYPRQPLPAGQRTLVTVVTNAEPLPLEQTLRQNDSSGGPIVRTRRHVTTTPYPNDRRQQNRKRPWQKQEGFGSGSTTLEIRKMPVEFNTISKLNEHFSKFGTVTNVQIAFDGSSDSALVAYSTFQEAETAYKNPEPLFNNRFIKVFWHNPNKSTEKKSTPPEAAPPPKKPIKHHWTKPESKPTEPVARPPPKKKPAGPSLIKKEAAKKASFEIRRKKQGLFEEQIQQQKLLLKKLETAETNEEKESIRALMKQVDATIVNLKDSLRTIPIKSAPPPPPPPPKLSQQDLLKQRAEKLKKELESLRAKTSADMRRAMSNTLETKLPPNETSLNQDEEDRLLSANEKTKNQQFELETHDEEQLLDP